jgi:hypothetical protein
VIVVEATLSSKNQATIQIGAGIPKPQTGRSVQVLPSAGWNRRHSSEDSDIEAERQRAKLNRPISVEEMNIAIEVGATDRHR